MENNEKHTLMAEHGGQGHRQMLVADADVGVADAGRDHPHEHLVADRIGQFGR